MESPRAGLQRFQSWLKRQSKDPEGQVLLALGTLGVLTGGWVLFWPVPTEVVGRSMPAQPIRALSMSAMIRLSREKRPPPQVASTRHITTYIAAFSQLGGSPTPMGPA